MSAGDAGATLVAGGPDASGHAAFASPTVGARSGSAATGGSATLDYPRSVSITIERGGVEVVHATFSGERRSLAAAVVLIGAVGPRDATSDLRSAMLAAVRAAGRGPNIRGLSNVVTVEGTDESGEAMRLTVEVDR